MSEYVFREVEENDYYDLVELFKEEEYFEECIPELRAIIDDSIENSKNGDGLGLVVVKDGRVIAHGTLVKSYAPLGCMNIEALIVTKNERSKGIGIALIKRFEEYAVAAEQKTVRLYTVKENTKAIRLYEYLGYERNDRWKIIERNREGNVERVLIALHKTF